MNEKLYELCKKNEIDLSEKQLEQFQIFYDYMIEMNQVMNLTSITEEDEVILKHFYDSMSIVKYFDFKPGKYVIDVGTGAGFPGIPLAILLPKVQFTLMDSLNKRIIFLQDVVKKCGLKNVECIHSRAEELAKNEKYREKYDVCVSRAVANLSVLLEYCIPFINESGIFISYKSEFSEEETDNAKKAIKVLGGKIEDTYIEELPHSDINRSFVVIKKERSTSNKYPRKAGVPSKKPIR